MQSSTANWHWKNKNITSWAKAWFERELTTIVIQGEDSASVSISSVKDVDGDAELGQRKSKYVYLFVNAQVFLAVTMPSVQIDHDL